MDYIAYLKMLTPIPLMIRQSMLGTNDPFPSQNRVINPDTRIDMGARKPPPRYVARRRSSPIHIPLLRLRKEISRRSEYGPDHDEPTSHVEVFERDICGREDSRLTDVSQTDWNTHCTNYGFVGDSVFYTKGISDRYQKHCIDCQ